MPQVNVEISFGQRLANEAQRALEIACSLPPGKKRDALLEKARLADLGARINGWLAPELAREEQPITRNGAVADAVPSALTRGPAHFDWQLAGATRSGAAGGECPSRSGDEHAHSLKAFS